MTIKSIHKYYVNEMSFFTFRDHGVELLSQKYLKISVGLTASNLSFVQEIL